MKKRELKSVVLALVLVLSMLMLTACGSSDNGSTDTSDAAADGVAAVLKANFEAEIAGNDDLMAVAQTIMANQDITNFEADYREVEEGYLNGFDADITGFNKGVCIAPFINGIPFVAYIFETDDTDALLETLNANANMAWNVCTEADQLETSVVDNHVFFVMAPSSFEEE